VAVAKTVVQLKKAINNANKCFVWTVFGCTPDGTPIGGYIEAYKSHLLGLLKNYQLPTQSWDTTVKCYFRVETETGHLYVEGFHAS
jgi:hypothetical protein